MQAWEWRLQSLNSVNSSGYGSDPEINLSMLVPVVAQSTSLLSVNVAVDPFYRS